MVPRYQINFELSQIEKKFCDFLIVGGGVAGLFTALKAAASGKEVMVLTKDSLEECNTTYAQGGIASVIREDDSQDLHFEDTLESGVNMCNSRAVEVLVEEGPLKVKELIDLGVSFDRVNYHYSLGREGAHSRDRVLHVGDSTGKTIQNVLMDSTRSRDNITIEEDVFVIDLLTYKNRCIGVLAYDENTGRVSACLSKVVVLATGGMGQLFNLTTNSNIATGDGLAMAYRAGAEVMDLEFIQFHPTVFYTPEGKAFLISEAVRGEGGILRNEEEEQFMVHYHPLADLGPRDVVARSIISVLKKTKTKNIYLDLRHLGEDFIRNRFPNIYCTLKQYNIDITTDLIPIVPAAHYTMGGVKTNLYGETNIPGLYAVGEAACAGVHGANRLASNSLLEGLVFGDRVVKGVKNYIKEVSLNLRDIEISCQEQSELKDRYKDNQEVKRLLRRIMFEKVGIIRSQDSLKQALNFIEENKDLLIYNILDKESFELKNIITLANLTARAALLREESRGAHYRQDFPSKKESWQKHLVFSLSRERKEELD